MSSGKDASPNGGGKSKDGAIAKVAGAVIVSGIAWSVYKSFGWVKTEDGQIEESSEAGFGEDYGVKDLEVDAKEKTDEFKSAAEIKSREFGSDGEGKVTSLFSLGRNQARKGKSKWSGTYEINKGDTIYGISRSYGVSVAALKAANGLVGDDIFAGDKLVVPK